MQQPATVKFEKSFEGVYPVAKIPVKWYDNKDEISFNFEGTGFVLRGETAEWGQSIKFCFSIQNYMLMVN